MACWFCLSTVGLGSKRNAKDDELMLQLPIGPIITSVLNSTLEALNSRANMDR